MAKRTAKFAGLALGSLFFAFVAVVADRRWGEAFDRWVDRRLIAGKVAWR